MTLLEKLAPYLPYETPIKPLYELIPDGDFYHDKLDTYVLDNYDLEDIKPILRPLSDLDMVNFTYQIIDSNTPYYCSVLDDFEAGDIDCTTLSYSHLQILLKNHYDVFGMIESGEAIDINTINK